MRLLNQEVVKTMLQAHHFDVTNEDLQAVLPVAELVLNACTQLREGRQGYLHDERIERYGCSPNQG